MDEKHSNNSEYVQIHNNNENKFISEDIIPSFQLCNIFYRGEDAQGFDVTSGDKWIYPTNYPVREYQFNIVKCALFENTLVCLPTGLGKTFIAAVVMYNYYRWYPKGKIIFMAPTRPLTKQQIVACQKIMGISREHMEEFTGQMKPELRREKWNKKRIFFATPQVIANDIKKCLFNIDDIKCIVFDEAHKAQGNFAYCEVIKAVVKFNTKFRVLALSATPGSTLVAVQQVLANLLISQLIAKDENSVDVKPYVHERHVTTVVVPLSNDIKNIKERFFKVVERYLHSLQKYKILHGSASSFTKYKLLLMHEEFTKSRAKLMHPSMASQIQGDFAALITLYSALELLTKHGVHSFLIKLEELVTLGSSNFKIRLSRDQMLCELINDIKEELSSREFQVQDPDVSLSKVETSRLLRESLLKTHPKMEKLEQIVVEHFQEFEKQNKPTKVIVFVENRSATSQICNVLQWHYPLVKAMIFIGQLKEGCLGYTQKKQIEVMKKFRNGTYNTLISTCVGEEGLDIGEVDLIVCYDTSASIVRLKQRFGRTGRQRHGRVIMLVTQGSEAEKLKKCMHRTNTMSSTLFNMQLLQPYFYKESPRMVPQDFEPQCLKMNLAVEPEPGHNQDVRKFFKPKRKSKDKSEALPSNISCDLDLLSYNRLSEGSYMSNMSVEAVRHILMHAKDHGDLAEETNCAMGIQHTFEQSNLSETCLVEHSNDTKDLMSLIQRAEAKKSKQFPATQATALASQVTASNICSKKGKPSFGKWIRKRKVTAPKCKTCGNCNDSDCKEISSRKRPAHDKCFPKPKSVNEFGVLDTDNVETNIKEPYVTFPEDTKTIQRETEADTLLCDVLGRALEQYSRVQNELEEKRKSLLKPVKLNMPPSLLEVLQKNIRPKQSNIDLSFESSLVPEQLQRISKERLKQFWNSINNQSTKNTYIEKQGEAVDSFNTKQDFVKFDNDTLHANEMPNFNLNVFLSTNDADKFINKNSYIEIQPQSSCRADNTLETTNNRNNSPTLETVDQCAEREVFQTSNNITFDLGLNDFFNDTMSEMKQIALSPSAESKTVCNNDKVIDSAHTDDARIENPVSPDCEGQNLSQRSIESVTSFELDYPESPVLGTQHSSLSQIQNKIVTAASSTPKGNKVKSILTKTVQETFNGVDDADVLEAYEVFSQSLLTESHKFKSAIENRDICNSDFKQSFSPMTDTHPTDEVCEQLSSITEHHNSHALKNDVESNLIHKTYASLLCDVQNKPNKEKSMTFLENRKNNVGIIKNVREVNEETVILRHSNAVNHSFGMNSDYDELFENLCTSLLEQKYEVLVKDTKIGNCMKNNTSALLDNSISSVAKHSCDRRETEIKNDSFISDSDIFSEFCSDFDEVKVTRQNETGTAVEICEKPSVEKSHENHKGLNFVNSLKNKTSPLKHTSLEECHLVTSVAVLPSPIKKSIGIQSVPKHLPQVTKKLHLFDDGDDDFIPVAGKRHDQKTKYNISDHTLSEKTKVAQDCISDQDKTDEIKFKKSRRKENKKQKRLHEFVEDEADVSVDCAISSDENSESFDQFDESFVDDEEDELINRHTELQQKFLHSMIKESDAPIEFKKHDHPLDVYSQIDHDPHDSYEEDSFCVKSSNDSGSSKMSELEIAEEILRNKRNSSLNEMERPTKRRRIIVLSSDSDDNSDNLIEEISHEQLPKNNLKIDIHQLKNKTNVNNIKASCKETSNLNMVSDNMPVNILKKCEDVLTWSDDDFENYRTTKPDNVTFLKRDSYLNHKNNAECHSDKLKNSNYQNEDKKHVEHLNCDLSSKKKNISSALRETNFSPQEIVVFISHRERNSTGVILRKLEQEYKAVVRFADLGAVDCAVSHRTGIVRLLIKGSVIEEDILSHKKVYILRSLFSNPVVIVERLYNNSSDSKEKHFEVPFHLARLMALETTLRILFSTNEDETVKIIYSLAHAETERGYGMFNATHIMDIHSKAKDFFMQLPGVNFALALYLWYKYKSISKFCERCKSVNDIERELSVDGDTAHHLHNILNNVVQP